MKSSTKFAFLFILALFSIVIYGCIDEPAIPRGNINGKIISKWGMPMSYRLVSAGNYPIVRVDRLGNFEFEGTPIPYDLTSTNEYGGTSTKYKNLSIPNPIINEDLNDYGTAHVSNLSVSFPAFPETRWTSIKFISEETFIQFNSDFPGGEDTAVTLGIEFPPDIDMISGTLIYIEWSGNHSHIYNYHKFGMKDLTLRANVTHEINFAPEDIIYNPAETESEYTTILPGNAELFYSLVSINFPGKSRASEFRISSNYDYNSDLVRVPIIPQLKYNLKLLNACIYSYGRGFSEKWIYFDPGQNVQLTQEETLLQITPENDERNVNDNTLFVINDTDPIPGVYQFYLYFDYDLYLHFFTDMKEVKFGDLKARGVEFQPNTKYSWTVKKYTGFESIDEFASVNLFKDNRYSAIPSSATFSFTTAHKY